MQSTVLSVKYLRKMLLRDASGAHFLPACEVLSYYLGVPECTAVVRLTLALRELDAENLLLAPIPRMPRLVHVENIPRMLHVVAGRACPGMRSERLEDIVSAAECHWCSRFAVVDMTPMKEGFSALRISYEDYRKLREEGGVEMDDFERMYERSTPYYIFGCEGFVLSEIDVDDITFMHIESSDGVVYRFGMHKNVLDRFRCSVKGIDRSLQTLSGLLRALHELGLAGHALAWMARVRSQPRNSMPFSA